MIEYRQLAQILVMFMIVMFFGMLLAIISFNGQSFQEIQGSALFSSYTTALFYIGYIVIVSAILVILFRTFNISKLFKVFEAVLIFISSFIVFSVFIGLIPYSFMNSVFGLPVGIGFIAAVILALFLVYAKNRWQYLRNAVAMLSAVGVGFLLGVTFTFTIAVIFMVFLAAYDFIAVFITKHMLSLAKMADENNLALLIGVNDLEGIPKTNFDKKALKEYTQAQKSIKDSTLKRLIREGYVPVAARIELGTGDLAMPLMVAVSAYTVYLNFVLPFFIIFGVVFGLILTMLILKKYRRALPAIPPLLLGIAVFIGIYFLIRLL